MCRVILITGATGKQGSAAIASLVALTGTQFTIHALTRNASSSSAQRLLAHPNVKLVEGDMDNLLPVFAKLGPIWAIFSVQQTSKHEATQGKAVVDAAVDAGVEYFVYSSGDREGDEKSELTATNVPHFACKFEVEQYLKTRAAEAGMAWTILRPTTYMENLTKDFVGKGFASMWRGLGSKHMQLVATKDIGYFTALVLRDSEQWKGKAISIAGDELSFKEAKGEFEEVFGNKMPETVGVVGYMLKRALGDVGTMFSWFGTDGFGADIKRCRELNPEMVDFKTWLREQSQFKTL